ncbi:MAG: response regulator [Reichenbachiella sp.]|uniref:response regulator n=1 Tax=Reichenbachiella sp. TaxID=2184521 RepID=UPI003264C053
MEKTKPHAIFHLHYFLFIATLCSWYECSAQQINEYNDGLTQGYFQTMDELLSEGGLQKFDSLMLVGSKKKQNRIDSLKQLVKNSDSREKVDGLMALSSQYCFGNEFYLQDGIRLAEKIEYTKGEAESRVLLGDYYISKLDTVAAIRQFELAISLWRKLGNEDKVANTKMWLAYGYSFFHETETRRHYNEAITLSETAEDSLTIASIELLIANIGFNIPSLNIDRVSHLERSISFGQADRFILLKALYELSLEKEIFNNNGTDNMHLNISTLNLELSLNDSSYVVSTISHVINGLCSLDERLVKSLIPLGKAALKIAPDNRDKMLCLGALGVVYVTGGKNAQGLDVFLPALEIAKTDDFAMVPFFTSSVMTTYARIDEFEEALKYAYDLLQLEETDFGSESMYAMTFINNAKYHISTDLIKKGAFEKAAIMLEDLLAQDKKVNGGGFKQVIGKAQLCYVFHKQGQSRRGLDSLKSMLVEPYDILYYSDDLIKKAINNMIGQIYFELGETDKAIKHLNLAEFPDTVLSVDNYVVYEYLSKSYATMGSFKKAYEYQVKLKELSDTLKHQKLLRKIGWIESQAELDKKNKENELLAKDKTLLEKTKMMEEKKNSFLISLSVLLVAVILLVVYLFHQRLKGQRRLLSKEKEMDRVKSRFFSNISHELRTPLALMMAPLRDVFEDSRDKERNAIATALDQCDQLESLADEILDLSKIDAKKLEYRPVPMNASLFIDRIIDGFKSLANSRGVDLHLSYLIDTQKWLMLDKLKLEKILNNLLSNALKHTTRGGEIQVVVNKSDDHKKLKIIVKDNGKGIHPKDLPHIFDRYYQARHAESKAIGGTGIGLHLSLELARLFGGDLQVDSRWEWGSTFTLTIPFRDVVPIANTAETSTASDTHELDVAEIALPNTVSPYKILVAEDHPSMQDFLGQMLSSIYQVKLASDGKEAWEMIQQEPVDLIISDMMMPEMDGVELIERIRSNETTAHLPIIMLTARADIEDKLAALTIGVDDYVTKPFHSQELLARVKNSLSLLESRRAVTADEFEDEAMNTSDEETQPVTWGSDWLQKVESRVIEKLRDSDFKIHDLAKDIGLSERQLYRRIKQLTGLTANLYIRETKLCQARDMLEQGRVQTVAEACYSVGFEDTKYFSKIFKRRFGRIPSEYNKKVNLV